MKKCVPEFEFSDEQLNTVKQLAAKVNLLEDTVKLLFARGADTEEKIQSFIHPSKEKFISPLKMQGMSEAVELITRARDEEWGVLVYGDYDADGVCASTIMRGVLSDFGIEAEVYVPERRDGYGLNKATIDSLFEEFFPQLVITVDCGISGYEEVEYIKEQGAEVIVTDHHELPAKIPDCICINPKFNDGYIYDNLCGAGVAFKVGVALLGKEAYKYLDFAAVATIADSVPLTGENRDIVYEGLKIINETPRKCFSYLLSKNQDVTSQTVAFNIAPRINAAGRMGDAKAALDLFRETDENKIFQFAAKLNEYNSERQKYCDELYTDAKRKINESGECGNVIMLYDDSWNTGFVGIVAARLAEEYARPAILFVKNGDVLKGSARSVENVNIFETLRACDEYLGEYGGHAQAAGVNVSVENFEKLKIAVNKYLAEHYLPSDFEHTVYISGSLNVQNAMRFAREIELLEPFGVGNRRPEFVAEATALDSKAMKAGSPHLVAYVNGFELLSFNGLKNKYLLNSGAPKKIIFDYNLSSFRGKDYVKGYIKSVIYDRSAAASCGEEIAVNNILTLANPAVPCKKVYKSVSEIDELMSVAAFGTVYIAGSYESLSRYKNADKFPVELFYLSGASLADIILISPRADADLGAFSRVVYLDDPKNVRLKSLEGKEVIISSEIDGCEYAKSLPAERKKLMEYYSYFANNAANIFGADSAEVALLDTRFKPRDSAFALEVFRQLGFLDFDGGLISFKKGIRRELTESELFNTVQSYENSTR